MSSFGENYKKNDLLDDIQHYFSDGGTIEEMFDVLRYIFEYGKTPFDDLQQENQKLKKQLDYALKLLSEIYPPCDIDGFMDKHSDYCEINCGVDEEIFKNCWLLYIDDKLKEVE